jgi:ribosomal protein S30
VSKRFARYAGKETDTEKKLLDIEKVEKLNKKIHPDSAHSEQPRQRNSKCYEAHVSLVVLLGILVRDLVQYEMPTLA